MIQSDLDLIFNKCKVSFYQFFLEEVHNISREMGQWNSKTWVDAIGSTSTCFFKINNYVYR
jgi:hypothetical protein